MRASELLGCEVVDAGGDRVGLVSELCATLDGARAGAVGVPRVTALLVTHRHTGTFLGYQQEGQRGPWLVRVIIERLQRRTVRIDWGDVASYEDGRVVLRSVVAEADRASPP